MTSSGAFGRFETDGFQVFSNVVDDDTRSRILSTWPVNSGAGSRQALRSTIVCELASCGAVGQLARFLLGERAKPVRGIYFDKSPTSNWLVPWHQDVTIATKLKVNIDGFSPWSEKEGVPHVQPPAEVLENMVALRIHLDDCLIDNGPLMVIPKSHTSGKYSMEEVEQRSTELSCTTLTCIAGDIIAMRPLLLHASSKASSPKHRRVLHIEFCTVDLPEPLEWFWQ